jgi:hypothetical protein
MSDNSYLKNFLLPSLHALQSQRPDKPMAQVRWAWVEINAALSAGRTLKAIHQRLCQDGVEIAYSTLARYINRVRCERARQTAGAGTFSGYTGRPLVKTQAHAAAREDPLASAMRALSKPTYSVREAMCDGDPTKKKLI